VNSAPVDGFAVDTEMMRPDVCCCLRLRLAQLEKAVVLVGQGKNRSLEPGAVGEYGRPGGLAPGGCRRNWRDSPVRWEHQAVMLAQAVESLNVQAEFTWTHVRRGRRSRRILELLGGADVDCTGS
jgi:hypothetical protein